MSRGNQTVVLILMSLIALSEQQCQTNNTELTNLNVVQGEFYKLPLFDYFSGEGLTFTTSGNADYSISEVASTYVANQITGAFYIYPIGDVDTFVAMAVQNYEYDVNIQSNNYAVLGNSSVGSYRVFYGQKIGTTIDYNPISQAITSPITVGAAGYFACTDIDFIYNSNVVVTCISASPTIGAQQYFIFVDFQSTDAAPVVVNGTLYPQFPQQSSYQSKTQVVMSSVTSVQIYTLNFQGNLQSGTINRVNGFQVTQAAGDITLKPITINTSWLSNKEFISDFYVSTNGFMFFLKNITGLYVQDSTGNQIATLNPFTGGYIKMAVQELQVLPDSPDFLIALANNEGFMTSVLNTNQQGNQQQFAHNRYVVSDSFSQYLGGFYINSQFIVIINNLEISVFPGPANNVNSDQLLFQQKFKGLAVSAYNLWTNILVVGNGDSQVIYQFNNPYVIASNPTSGSALNVTATDLEGQICSQLFTITVLQSESSAIYTRNSETIYIDQYYPIVNTFILSTLFDGPAITYQVIDNTAAKGAAPINVIQYVELNGMPQSTTATQILYSQNFYNPTNVQSYTFIQITYDSTGLINIIECDPLANVNSTLTSYTIDTSVVITEFDIGFTSDNYYWGYLVSNGTVTLYIVDNGESQYYYQTSLETEDAAILVGQFRIFQSEVYLITTDPVYIVALDIVTGDELYQVESPNTYVPHLYTNQLAYGSLLFVDIGTELIIFKTVLGEFVQINTIDYPLTDSVNTAIGLTNDGLYIGFDDPVALYYYPTVMIYNSTISLFTYTTPLQLPLYSYTLVTTQFASSYDHFYIAATDGTQNTLLVFQDSPSSLSSLYYAQELPYGVEYISVVGWDTMDCLLVGLNNPTYIQNANAILYPTASVQFTPNYYNFSSTALTYNFIATNSISNNKPITVTASASVYNYGQYVEVITDAPESSILGPNGLLSFDPRRYFYGNIMSYTISDTLNSDITVQFQQPLSLANKQPNLLNPTSATVLNAPTASYSLNYTLVQNNNQVQLSAYSYKGQLVSNQSYQLPFQNCPYLFTEFYTGMPVSVCQDTNSEFINFYQYNVETKANTTISFNLKSNYMLVDAYYMNGPMILIFQVGDTDQYIVQPGVYMASTTNNLFFQTAGQNQTFIEGFNQTFTLPEGTSYTSLNIDRYANLQEAVYGCTTTCNINFGIITLSSTGITQGYIFQLALDVQIENFYNTKTAITTQVVNIPTTPLEFNPNIYQIVGDSLPANAVFGDIAQINSAIPIGNTVSVPVLLASQGVSYQISLIFSGEYYISGQFNCYFLGDPDSLPQQILAQDGIVLLNYLNSNGGNANVATYTLASYGNYEEICLDYGFTTIIGTYQYTSSSDQPAIALVTASAVPSALIAQYQNLTATLIQVTPEVFISVQPKVGSATTLFNQTNLNLIVAANSFYNSNAQAKVTLNYEGVYMAPLIKVTNNMWILYICLGLFALLGTLGFLCYKANQKQQNEYDQAEYAQV